MFLFKSLIATLEYSWRGETSQPMHYFEVHFLDRLVFLSMNLFIVWLKL